MRPRSLLVRYAAGLAFAYVLSAAEVVAIVISVSRETVIEAQSVLSGQNLIATVAIVIVGTATVWASGVALVARALDRAGHARETVPPQQRKAPNITRRQSAILLTPWGVAAVVMIPLNIGGGIRVVILIVSAIMFGATATVCTGFLFTQTPSSRVDGRRHSGFRTCREGAGGTGTADTDVDDVFCAPRRGNRSGRHVASERLDHPGRRAD
jgi:hypothetical protein